MTHVSTTQSQIPDNAPSKKPDGSSSTSPGNGVSLKQLEWKRKIQEHKEKQRRKLQLNLHSDKSGANPYSSPSTSRQNPTLYGNHSLVSPLSLDGSNNQPTPRVRQLNPFHTSSSARMINTAKTMAASKGAQNRDNIDTSESMHGSVSVSSCLKNPPTIVAASTRKPEGLSNLAISKQSASGPCAASKCSTARTGFDVLSSANTRNPAPDQQQQEGKACNQQSKYGSTFQSEHDEKGDESVRGRSRNRKSPRSVESTRASLSPSKKLKVEEPIEAGQDEQTAAEKKMNSVASEPESSCHAQSQLSLCLERYAESAGKAPANEDASTGITPRLRCMSSR